MSVFSQAAQKLARYRALFYAAGMDSVFDRGSPEPCPTPFNMADYVLAAGRTRPDKIALCVVGSDRQLTYTFADITAAILGIAQGYLDMGLAAQDRILLRIGNRPETPFAYLAALAVDMVPVPTSAQLTALETARIIDDLHPALVLTEDNVPCADHPNKLELNALRLLATNKSAETHLGDPDRPAYIVYTSGTSGNPRAVQHAHRSIWARRMMYDNWYGLAATDRVLHAGAFNWTYTMGTGLMDPWSVGATAIIPQDGTPIESLPALIERSDATIFAAAPGVFRKMLKNTKTIVAPRLRHGLSAGEKLSAPIRQAWQQATGTKIHEAFGMSECSTFISGSPTAPAQGDATGLPQLGRKVAILDDNGTPCPRGTAGTIAIHSSDPGLMLGYLNAADETHARMTGDWFLTGDRGVMAKNDQITYLGRNDDMMNAGGYRVSPLEVEKAFVEFPGIHAMAVTTVDTGGGTQIIAGFYTADSPIARHDLVDFAKQRLAHYKCPRDYVYVSALPVGPNGKLVRKSLQSLWRPS